jgi:hypothetical protein
MNKEVLAKWEERAKGEGLQKFAFLRGVHEYREALRVLVEGLDENQMKTQFLHFLQIAEPLPDPPANDTPCNEGYF